MACSAAGIVFGQVGYLGARAPAPAPPGALWGRLNTTRLYQHSTAGTDITQPHAMARACMQPACAVPCCAVRLTHPLVCSRPPPPCGAPPPAAPPGGGIWGHWYMRAWAWAWRHGRGGMGMGMGASQRHVGACAYTVGMAARGHGGMPMPCREAHRAQGTVVVCLKGQRPQRRGAARPTAPPSTKQHRTCPSSTAQLPGSSSSRPRRTGTFSTSTCTPPCRQQHTGRHRASAFVCSSVVRVGLGAAV